MDPDPHQAAQLAQAQAEAVHIQHQIKLEQEIQQQHFLAQNAAAAQMSLFGQHNMPQAGAGGLHNSINSGIGHNGANCGQNNGQPKANNLILESSQTIDQVVSQCENSQNMQIESEEALNSSNNCGEDDDDAEGVWSPDIETCFTEALQMYPPCGRRKIILSEEGKMYGRNELIARYIKMRTGKVRSRKQVSSHIQVLARRKMREVQVSVKQGPISPVRKDSILTSLANMSSAQIVSAAANAKHLQQSGQMGFGYAGGNSAMWNRPGIGLTNEVQDAFTATRLISANAHVRITHFEVLVEPSKQVQTKQGPDGTAVFVDRRSAAAADDNNNQQVFKANHDKFHCILQINPVLSPNSIQMESIDICQVADKFPRNKFENLFDKSPNKDCFYLIKFWADLNFDFGDYEENAFYSVTQQFESQMPVKLQVTTDVNSFGKEAVEKIEVESSVFDETIGRHITRINKSSICEYMIKFIYILKNLESKSEMNTVLENFTLLQQVINRDTDELLFCIAFVFESSGEGQGPHHHIYQLIKGGNENPTGGSPSEMMNTDEKI